MAVSKSSCAMPPIKRSKLFEGLNGKPLKQAIQKNLAILKACPVHDFLLEDMQYVIDRIHCKNCGGEVYASEARWYHAGYLAGLAKGQEIVG